jgi:hypothetical protein
MINLGMLKPPSLATVKGSVGDDRLLTQDKDMMIGAVYTAEIKKDLLSGPLFNFFQLLANNDYTTRDSNWYTSLSLTYCKGSVLPHNDPSYGLTALWLINVKPLHKNQRGFKPEAPSFYSPKQWSDVYPGEIIVFDADKEHAWLSNYHCSMIMQTIKRTRRTRNVEAS